MARELWDYQIAARRKKSLSIPKELGSRILALLSARPLALGGQHSSATDFRPGEVTNEWAERFCEAVNWSPDGQECKTVEGQMRCVSFRDLAKGYILSAIATQPDTTPARAEAQDEGAAGEFETAEAMAEAWSDRVEIQRMVETTSAVFAKWASPEILSRFRQQMMGVIQQAYIEGVAARIDVLHEDDAGKPYRWMTVDKHGFETIYAAKDRAETDLDSVNTIPLYAHPSPPPPADADRVRIAVEALEDAAHEAHGRGYVQGFADAVWDETGDYDEKALTENLDPEKLRDGWYDDALHTYRDAQTKALAALKSEGK